MDAHRLAEERSLALHRAIAERLREDPSLVERARRRVAEWLANGAVHREYAEAWSRILERDADAIARAIVVDDEATRALRQVTPFAGIVPPRERWRIWRDVRERGR